MPEGPTRSKTTGLPIIPPFAAAIDIRSQHVQTQPVAELRNQRRQDARPQQTSSSTPRRDMPSPKKPHQHRTQS